MIHYQTNYEKHICRAIFTVIAVFHFSFVQLLDTFAGPEIIRTPLAVDKDKSIVLLSEESAPLTVNRLQTVMIRLESKTKKPTKSFVITSFDARMPDHNHGMVVKPVIEKVPGQTNAYRVRGVKLHMSGDWVFYVSGLVDQKKFSEQISYNLP